MSTFARWESIEEVEIWGGKSTLDRVQALLYGVVLDFERLPIKIHLIDLKPGQIMDAKDFTVSAFPVTHRGPGNFGFIFQEKSRRPFLVEKAEALGVPAGPERTRLVKGEAVTLEDGRVIEPDMVLGDLIPGVKLVHIGDTAHTDNLKEFVAQADALVIEATFLDENTEEARAFGHITAKEAATLALETGVKTLLLTHVSRRYRERDVIDEARRVFPNTIVARDLEQYAIRRDQAVQKQYTQANDDEKEA
jgi:ribonuclease Z